MGSRSWIRCFLATSGFSLRLPLRFLLSGGNVSSCLAVTYMPRLRHIFGYTKVARLLPECKPWQAQVSLFPDRKKRRWGDRDGSGNRVSEITGEGGSDAAPRLPDSPRGARRGCGGSALPGFVLTSHSPHA